MVPKLVRTVLVVALLCAPFMPGRADADEFPRELWEPEWVGILCLRVSRPGLPTQNVLAQFHFDKGSFETVSDADSLFATVGSLLTQFGPLVGSSAPQVYCSLKPSAVDSQTNGANAYQVATALAGQFTQLGFARYVVFDVYHWEAPFPTTTPVLRTDFYRIQGVNDTSYVASLDIVRSLVPESQ